MPRPPRPHAPGLIFHVMARGVQGQPIFEDESDYRAFLSMLAEAKKAHGLEVFAYCLMTNHFHALIRVGNVSISTAMASLLARYSKHFNRRRTSLGHVFQDRFRSVLCRRDSQLLQTVRYIHLNPVAATMTRSFDEWRWSSHGEYVGRCREGITDPALILSLVSTRRGAARLDDYAAFMRSARDPSDVHQALFGRSTERRLLAEALGRPALIEIFEPIGRSHGVSLAQLRAPGRDALAAQARRRLVLDAVQSGYSTKEVAAFMNRTASLVLKLRNSDRSLTPNGITADPTRGATGGRDGRP